MSDTDSSPESLGKFLESDDPSLVLKGLSIAKDVGVEEELLPLVLAHALFNDEDGIRQQADSLFAAHASAETNAVRTVLEAEDLEGLFEMGEAAVNFLAEIFSTAASLSR